MAIRSENAVDKFIARWQSASGSERANYQLFVHELCTLLELPTPDPAREDTRDNAYEPLTRAAEQLEINTGEQVVVATKPGARRPWPATLPAQVKAVAEVLTTARAPLADDAIAACFTGRGAWKKRLPQIIDTLVAVGRVRRRKDGLAVVA